MVVVNRRELKYVISERDYYRLENTLKTVLTPDKSNGLYGYRIRSVYFDSINNDDFYSKTGGEEIRKKIRLRIYSPHDTKVKLEIKRKMNINQKKETAIISKEDALALINKLDYSVLLKYDNPIAKAAYNIMTLGHYRPVVLVDYNRRAFIHEENSIRVTLDSDIRTNEFNFNMFDENISLDPVFMHWNALMEIKFNGDMFCWVTDVLKPEDDVYQSLSKYCSCRQFFDMYLS